VKAAQAGDEPEKEASILEVVDLFAG